MEKQVTAYRVSEGGICVDEKKKIWLNTTEDFIGNLKEKIAKGDILKVQVTDAGKMTEFTKIGVTGVENFDRIISPNRVHIAVETSRIVGLQVAVDAIAAEGKPITKENIKEVAKFFAKYIETGE